MTQPRAVSYQQVSAETGFIAAIASAVADELERRGLLAAAQPPGPWLDVAGAAEYLRCSEQRMYDLVRAGSLTPGRDGRRLLFRRDQLDSYLSGDGGRKA